MLRTAWTGGSLRFWVAVGMVLTVTPLALSAVAGYVMLDRGVIAAFKDVGTRQRDQIRPLQHVRLMLWEIASPIGNYLDSGRVEEAAAYHNYHGRIEKAFAGLHEKMRSEPEMRTQIDRAHDDWISADRIAATILSAPHRAGDSRKTELMDGFDNRISAAVGKLGDVHKELETDIDADDISAYEAYARAQWLAGTAAIVSGLMMISGIVIIGRFMLASVGRLVDGAARFAAGDRDHRIDIQVPPELRRVATEFNHMITRIHDTETALANLALRDALTGLLNRRAFNETIADVLARMRRFDEKAALVMFDLDHFKRINDTYGHAIGDDVLRAVAHAMVSSVRDIDKVFRIGGEEFVVLLQGTDVAAAQITAERLRTAIADQSIPVDGGAIAVTVSGGIALAHHADTVDTLMKAADEALYRAKAGGRNRIVSDKSDIEVAGL